MSFARDGSNSWAPHCMGRLALAACALWLSLLPLLCAFQTIMLHGLSVALTRRAPRGAYLRPVAGFSTRRTQLNGIMGVGHSNEVNVEHLQVSGSHIDPYWIEQLRRMEKPAVRALISQLIPDNPLGFDSSAGTTTVSRGPVRTGTLLDYTIQQKKRHPHKVILIRSGEFYETYGVDALMLIAYAGLNPMGNKCKAGCPVRNVQSTLDGLTSVGLSVAIFEEIAEIEKNSKVKIKSRALTQIVSPASSTYIYDLCLRADDIDFRENRPAVGIAKTTSGYTLCQVFLDEHAMVVHERLTEEGVRSLVSSSGAIDPIFIQDAGDLAFLANHHAIDRLSGYSEQTFPTQLLQRIGRLLEVDTRPFHIVSQAGYGVSGGAAPQRPRPVYTSTGLQVGLLPNDNVPSLIPHLLPKAHQNAYVSRFLRKWVLSPPPYALADEMSRLCRALSVGTTSLPPLSPMSVGKVVSLLNAKQGNVHLFRDVYSNALSLEHMLTHAKQQYSEVVPATLALTSFECGIPADAEMLLEGSRRVAAAIESVVADEADEDASHADRHQRVPDEFFRRNEEEFRGKISLGNAEVRELYEEVRAAAEKLCEAVRAEFPVGAEVVHDMMENAIMLREKPAPAQAEGSAEMSLVTTTEMVVAAGRRKSPARAAVVAVPGVRYVPYLDRRGKVMAKRYTTEAVTAALDEYLSVVATAPLRVSRILQALSETLLRDMVAIVQAAHFAVILQSALAHTVASIQKGWALPTLVAFDATEGCTADPTDPTDRPRPTMQLRGLTPYWLSRGTATSNDLDLDGIFLLTAPNMSGKSTLMRAALVAALLGNCGLFVPATAARIPRFDTFFLRTASYDVPSEAKSAFALEMEDMRVVLRDATSRSLVMIDELGKGTSARDGSALAGALLEHLDLLRVYGIFATHLHEIFHLPLVLRRVVNKRMGFVVEDESEDEDEGRDDEREGLEKETASERGQVRWTYRLEDGKCLDSMALATARQYHIAPAVLTRAQQLLQAFDGISRPGHAAHGKVARGDDSSHGVEVLPVTPSTPEPRTGADAGAAGTAVAYDLQGEVAEIVLGVVVDRVGAATGIVHVPVNHMVPAALEGSSCVYVLYVYPLKNRAAATAGGVLYVGETESMSQRLHQHRLSYRRQGMQVEAIACAVPDKSIARQIETSAIHALKRAGFGFEKDSDARHTLFGQGGTKM